MSHFIFATHNSHKVKELKAMLPQLQIKTLIDLNHQDEIAETASDLKGNALIKAQEIYDLFGGAVIADDTGLEVLALNGAPGVRSARYAGEPKNDTKNLEKLLGALKGEKNRKAQFRTVICLLTNEKTLYFEGIVKGTISEKAVGIGGFGYDPVFVPDGFNQSFAELPPEVKNHISHRGLAVQKLVQYLQGAR
ncbi:MAG: RdgB/HAM1 family non-canonical purine NTP pyrophosphatase [Flavobacteriaceae bacterium]|nr:RdgB/HAM1 family non-canonical purine NTP pyrophosphatase [Flavobacteriaceae bacterium]